MEKENAIGKYEEMLLTGKKMYIVGTPEEKSADALHIIRYVVEEMLGWTPEEAMDCLTPEIAGVLKLDIVIKLCLQQVYPPDLDPKEDIDYAVHLAYPHVHYNLQTKVIDMYKKIMSGKKFKFPKKYFVGDNGAYKASLLLYYVISENVPVKGNDVADLYRLFADAPKINAKMKEWHIFDVCRSLYGNALEYLHASLGDYANDFLFNYYSFMSVYSVFEKEYAQELKKQALAERKAKLLEEKKSLESKG